MGRFDSDTPAEAEAMRAPEPWKPEPWQRRKQLEAEAIEREIARCWETLKNAKKPSVR